jgi:predicted Rdx family selenoprotein
LYAFGSQVQGVALMPATGGLFTNPLNLIFGIQRKINIEYDKDIRARTFIIVRTARVDCAIEQSDAVVKYTGIQ